MAAASIMDYRCVEKAIPFVKIESITPAEFRNRDIGLKIRYGFHPSPFGECMIAVTESGISNLSFVQGAGRAEAVRDLKTQWGRADVVEDPAATGAYAEAIFGNTKTDNPLTLHLKGTNFQLRVWQALLEIPKGSVASYEEIARAIGRPRSVRAVANAVAGNPVAYLIPCHRVIRKTGAIGGYAWGVERKKAMLAWEAADMMTRGAASRS